MASEVEGEERSLVWRRERSEEMSSWEWEEACSSMGEEGGRGGGTIATKEEEEEEEEEEDVEVALISS